jgi:hypothetical protein
MDTIALIESLSSRGVSVWAERGIIKVSPSSALTDDDRQAIRANKPELLALLTSPTPTERPRSGSFARPTVLHTNRSICGWEKCGGQLVKHSDHRYQCQSCGDWFELKPLSRELTLFLLLESEGADDLGPLESKWIN